MSSLSRQVSALRRSSKNSGIAGRASFLFTYEDAQRVDTETIYNIALTGLTQLTKMDTRFVQFEGKLFGTSARTLRRDHETQEVNSRIDRDVTSYLRLLSAYLLQRPAQQTLEFLVRAYQVHRFNVDAVVECFIPYHQTKPFIRMVKILQIQGTKWQFLAAVRQTGAPLLRKTLVKQSLVDASILQSVMGLIQRIGVTSQPDDEDPRTARFMSFYTALVLEMISEMPSVTESFLQQLLPVVLQGLRASHVIDFQISSYMIVTRLGMKAPLAWKVQNALVLNITKYSTEQSSMMALMCLFSLFDNQKIDVVPESAFENLLLVPNLSLKVSSAAQKFDGSQFVTAMVNTVLPKCLKDQKYAQVLQDMIVHVAVVDKLVPLITTSLLASYANSDHAVKEDVETYIQQFLQLLSKRHPEQLDQGLRTMLESAVVCTREKGGISFVDDERARGTADGTPKMLFDLVCRTFSGSPTGFRHMPMGNSGTTLFLALEHPEASLRLQALREIGKLESERSSSCRSLLDCSVLVRRFQDDDAEVVKCVLTTESIYKILLQKVAGEKLFICAAEAWEKWAVHGSELLGDADRQNAMQKAARVVLRKLLAFLTGPFTRQHPSTFSSKLLPLVLSALPSAQARGKYGKLHEEVLKCAIGLGHPLLKGFDNVLSDTDIDKKQKASLIGGKLVKKLAENIAGDITGLLPLCRRIIETTRNAQYILLDAFSECAAFFSSKHQAPHNVSVDVPLPDETQLIATLTTLLALTWKRESAHLQTNPSNCDATSALNFLSRILQRLASSIKLLTDGRSDMALSNEMIELATLVLSSAPSCFQLLQPHLNTLCQSRLWQEQQFTMCALIYGPTAKRSGTTVSQQRALQLSATYLHAVTEAKVNGNKLSKIMTEFMAVFPVLICTLGHPQLEVRMADLAVLRAFRHLCAASEIDGDIDVDENKFSIVSLLQFINALLTSSTILLADRSNLRRCLDAFLIPRDRVVRQRRRSRSGSMDRSSRKRSASIDRRPRSESIDISEQIIGATGLEPAVGEQVLLYLLRACVRLEIESPHVARHLLNALQYALSLPEVWHTTNPLLIKLLRQYEKTHAARTETSQKESMYVDRSLMMQTLLRNFQWVVQEKDQMQISDVVAEDVFQAGVLALSLSAAPSKNPESSPQVLVLENLSKEMCRNFSLDQHDQLFSIFLHLLRGANQRLTSSIYKVIKHFPLERVVASARRAIETLVQKSPVLDGSSKIPLHKKRKASAHNVGSSDGMDRVEWLVQVTVLTEVMHISKEHATGDENSNTHEAMKELWLPLMSLMETLMHPIMVGSTDLEFAKQLVLDALLTSVIATSCIDKGASETRTTGRTHKRSAVESNATDAVHSAESVKVVVDCIQQTDNPQTRTAALLVLSAMAEVWPQPVLQTLLPVFTCIGKSTMQQNDSYAFSVMQQMLKAVIPPMKQRQRVHQHKGMSLQDLLQFMLKSIENIPAHRRLTLIAVTVQAIAPCALSTAVVILLKQHFELDLVDSNTKKFEKIPKKPSEKVDDIRFDRPGFAHTLCEHFNVVLQLETLVRLVQEAITLCTRLKSSIGGKKSVGNTILASQNRDNQLTLELKHDLSEAATHKLMMALINFVNNHLTSKTLHYQLLALAGSSRVQHTYIKLSQIALQYIGRLNASKSSALASNVLQNKFWARLETSAYTILDNIQQLLNVPGFVAVVGDLLHHNDAQIRRKALLMLNDKITANKDDLSYAEVQLFVEMVSELEPLLLHSLQKDADPDAISTQTALLCIDTLGRSFAAEHSVEFQSIVRVLMQFVDVDVATQAVNKQVLSTVFLCLSTLCSESGPLLLPYVPKLVPKLLDSFELTCLDGQVLAGDGSALALLQQSSLTSTTNVVRKLPSLFHPYLPRLIVDLCDPAILKHKNNQIADSHSELCKTVALAVEPRHVIPSITQAYRACTERKHGAIVSISQLLQILGDALAQLKNCDVAAHYTHVFKFFLVVMCDKHITYDSGQRGQGAIVAHALNSAFLTFIMKLNETQLRPLFLKLCDWEAGDPSQRRVTFFHLIDTIAGNISLCKSLINFSSVGRLKGIFVPYFGYLLQRCVDVLDIRPISVASKQGHRKDQTSASSSCGCEGRDLALRQFVLSALYKCFLHDTDGFVDQARTELLLQPLVNQLNFLDTVPDVRPFLEALVVPCIAQFAAAMGNEKLWKSLNTAVLMKTRSESPSMRFTALRIFQEFFALVGEEYIVMLPESIPFLSELMEDDNAEVEALCHKLAKIYKTMYHS